MFDQLQPKPVRPSRTQYASLLTHVAILAWLVHVPAPRILAPSSMRSGVRGGSVAQLYWPDQAFANAKSGIERSPSAARQQASHSARLRWKPSAKSSPLSSAPSLNASTDSPGSAKADAAALPAGSSYGSASMGAADGHEIRPALWASGTDPVLDVPRNLEGNEIVEITIDEQGNVIETHVLQSLGPQIDAKVVAALENWHFHPATRDGMPIASKQDVYYHFPRS
ncbi:MAG TPA: energy transducer TonB [Terriglobales bacterium]|nr:energy transducer TonB [Terriglobales bacterium]